MSNNVYITGRILGRTRRWMEEMEAYIKEHPGEEIMWPSSPWPKAAKPTYDCRRLNRDVHDYDDPWYVPIEWAIANPEKYAEFLENKRKTMEAWNKALNIKMPEDMGKMIITSLVDTGQAMYKTLWDDSDPQNKGLKRFFIPAYRKYVDEFGNEKV